MSDQEAAAELRVLSDAEMLQAALEVVTLHRFLELTGWCVYWLATGETDSRVIRRKLQAAGMSRSAAYRALDDLKAIGDRWNELERQPARSWQESVKRLPELSF